MKKQYIATFQVKFDPEQMMKPNDFKELWFRDKAYLLERPSIDRIDNDGHYTKENCRYIEWNRNKCVSRPLTCIFPKCNGKHFGRGLCHKHYERWRWRKKMGLSHKHIEKYLVSGYDWRKYVAENKVPIGVA